MNTKTVSIVGSGISGLMSAVKLLKKNYKINIFESSNSIGGILDDLKKDNEKYFNGCHYFLSEYSYYSELFKLLDIKYALVTNGGSFTDFDNNKENIIFDFAGPTFGKEIKDIKLQHEKTISIKDRISCYPSIIARNLEKWLKRYNFDLNDIAWNSSEGLQLSRVYIKGREEEVLEYKKKETLADEMYAVPRKMIGLTKVKGLLPEKGYNDFFAKFSNYLKSKDINIYTNSAVFPQWNSDNLQIFLGKKKIETNSVIWTANPTVLIRRYNSKRLDSVCIEKRVLCFDLKKNVNQNYFIQVFSDKSSLHQIYIYNIDGKNKVTFELFNEDENINDVINYANRILKKFDIQNFIDKQNPKIDQIQKRYFLLSLKDKIIIQDFKKDTKNSNLIPGPWEIYTRDKKLSNIFENFKYI